MTKTYFSLHVFLYYNYLYSYYIYFIEIIVKGFYSTAAIVTYGFLL